MRKLLKIVCRDFKEYVNRKVIWHIPEEERPATIFQCALQAVDYNRELAIKMVNELCDQESKEPGFWHYIESEENINHDIQCSKNKQ